MENTETKNKIKSPLKAIRAHCLQCVGTSNAVKECGGDESCPLFDFRFGKNPYRKVRVMSKEERIAAAERLRIARENK